MLEFFITFAVVCAVVLALGIGVMAGRKPIAGSCGGHNVVGAECAAGCKTPCEKRRARQRAAEEAIAREAAESR